MAPSPITGRKLRSGSCNDVTMDSLKTLLNECKKEMMAKMDEISDNVASLVEKVKELESAVVSLKMIQDNQQREIESLKRTVSFFPSANELVDETLQHVAKVHPPMDELVKELELRQRKANSIVVFGLPESISGSVREKIEHDTNETKRIIQFLDVQLDCQISECRRIGKPDKNGSRILRVDLNSLSAKLALLRRSKALKNSPFHNVFIKSDLTPMQQRVDSSLRRELKERRVKGEDVVLYKGRIHPKQTLSNFRS